MIRIMIDGGLDRRARIDKDHKDDVMMRFHSFSDPRHIPADHLQAINEARFKAARAGAGKSHQGA